MVVPNTPETKLLAEWNAKLDACRKARIPYERQWYTNLAMYFGRHYATWIRNPTTTSGLTLIEPQNEPWRVRDVTNKIKPTIRKEMSKLNKEQPQFYIVPPTTKDEDIAACRAGESLAEHFILGNSLGKKRRQAIWWETITGVGFFKCWYNANFEDATGIGAPVYESPSPFHIFVPNLEVEEIELQPYVVHSRAIDPDVLYALYKIQVDPNTESTNGSVLESQFLSGIGVKTKTGVLKQVHINEFWIKPCRSFPDGAMFIATKDKILFINEELPEFDPEGNRVQNLNPLTFRDPMGPAPKSSYPYNHKRYPFIKLDHIPAGRFYSQSVIDDLISPQKNYNRWRSQILESRNLTSKPAWTAVKGSVDPAKLRAIPGQVILHQPGFDPPKVLQLPELPSYHLNDGNIISSDFDFITRQTEVNNGGVPPGVEAASAIAYLQEDNDTIYGPTINSIEESIAELGYQTLMLVRQFWDTERMVKITSGSEMFETMLFKGTELPENIDFRVVSGSMAPRSIAAKQALVMELMKSGALSPVDALKYMQMAETNRMYSDLQVDARHAQREDYRMKSGQPVELNAFDNDIMHIITHERFMKSQDFEILPNEIKQNFLQHHAAHIARLGKSQLAEESQGDKSNVRTGIESGTGIA